MERLFHWLQRRSAYFYKAFLFLLATFLIVQLFPRQPRFAFDYQQGRPWAYEDLIAPYNFAILKSEAELESEKQESLVQILPFFNLSEETAEEVKNQFGQSFSTSKEAMRESSARQRRFLDAGMEILDSLYMRGVVFLEDSFAILSPSTQVHMVSGNRAELRRLSDFYTISGAIEFLRAKAVSMDLPAWLHSLLLESIAHNVVYYPELTRQATADAVDGISLSRGMVQQGERIISRGEVVDSRAFQVLESYKAEHEKQTGLSMARNLLYLGQFLLVAISMVVLVLFLYVFRREVFYDNRRVLLILLTVYIMTLLTATVIRFNTNLLYLIPVCIVPLVIRAFFDSRLALYIHIITIILVGFLIPRSFEFVFIQFIAGIVAILSMVSLRRRSQLFATVMLIFLMYAAVYLGLSLAHSGSTAFLRWTDLAYFLGAASLTLLTYPIIYLYERIFGLPTDFSLLELSDTNNELLRQLGQQAPGTFQHSLQVANLAEEAIFAIGGNSLLTRTGALYHDIGKMDNPFYFTENQMGGFNPHDEISYQESARIVINHVIKGIEMARKHNLPEYIIDFIRTHHGSTTARYFYTMQQKQSDGEIIERELFAYPGPRPFSKETAVVMMADAVEAASRSLSNPDEQRINELVEQIIDTQIAENQFENASVTFRDISTVKKIFKRRLLNIYHVRVAYPSFN